VEGRFSSAHNAEFLFQMFCCCFFSQVYRLENISSQFLLGTFLKKMCSILKRKTGELEDVYSSKSSIGSDNYSLEKYSLIFL